MKPTLRDKKRYLLYNIDSSTDIDLQKAISELILKYFGVLGISQTSLKVLYILDEQKKMLLRCKPEHVQTVCFVFSLINHYYGKPIRFELIAISGTIASLKRKKGLKLPQKNF